MLKLHLSGKKLAFLKVDYVEHMAVEVKDRFTIHYCVLQADRFLQKFVGLAYLMSEDFLRLKWHLLAAALAVVS